MSIISIIEAESSFKQPWRVKLISVLKCDICEKITKEPFRKEQLDNINKMTHCSRNCYHKNRKRECALYNEMKNTSLGKNGVTHHFYLDEFKEKTKQTSLKKYGTDWATQSNIIKTKIKNTVNRKYGVDNVFQLDEVKKKSKITLFKNYGVYVPIHSKIIQDKIKKILLHRYGVDHGFKTKNNRKIISSSDIHKKRHETMKKNGNYGKSKAEDKFYEFLQRHFLNVERQKFINRWPVDFYLSDHDIFIQFDGNYWHGIDKTFEELQQSNVPRNSKIAKTKVNDIIQNEWFKMNQKKLVRIKEIDFKNKNFELIIESIKNVI